MKKSNIILEVMDLRNIYYIGGSPCSGKSTIAEMICEKYGFQYFKADDFLMDFIAKGAEDGNKLLKHISDMSLDQLWLREPAILHDEEMLIYKSIYPYFSDAINKLDEALPIIAEGAAFLPAFMNEIGVPQNHYVCVAPSKDFQFKHYSDREWVNDYLSACSNKEKALNNWMERDALFALSVLDQAIERGYPTIIVDGTKSIEENFKLVLGGIQVVSTEGCYVSR